MRITVRAKAGARRQAVEELAAGQFAVAVREPAQDSRANRAIERALAEHFGVPPSRVRIVLGEHRREKVVEISRD